MFLNDSVDFFTDEPEGSDTAEKHEDISEEEAAADVQHYHTGSLCSVCSICEVRINQVSNVTSQFQNQVQKFYIASVTLVLHELQNTTAYYVTFLSVSTVPVIVTTAPVRRKMNQITVSTAK